MTGELNVFAFMLICAGDVTLVPVEDEDDADADADEDEDEDEVNVDIIFPNKPFDFVSETGVDANNEEEEEDDDDDDEASTAAAVTDEETAVDDMELTKLESLELDL